MRPWPAHDLPDGRYLYFTSDRSFTGKPLGPELSPAKGTPLPLSDGAMKPLSTLRAGAADSPEVAPDDTRRRSRSRYLLLNVGGWLVFGTAIF